MCVCGIALTDPSIWAADICINFCLTQQERGGGGGGGGGGEEELGEGAVSYPFRQHP